MKRRTLISPRLSFLLASFLLANGCYTSLGNGKANPETTNINENNEEEILCVSYGSAYSVENKCLEEEKAFAEKFVPPEECIYSEEVRCIQVIDAEPNIKRIWVFSGEHFGLPDEERTTSCDEAMRAEAIAAPYCENI
jgi:hypothetical protein